MMLLHPQSDLSQDQARTAASVGRVKGEYKLRPTIYVHALPRRVRLFGLNSSKRLAKTCNYKDIQK
jgi:hypothetical protein